MTAHEKNRSLTVVGEGANAAPAVPAEHPKRSRVAERFARAVANMCFIARNASRLTQEAWAESIGTTRNVVSKHESALPDDTAHALNLNHMLAMSDASLDALLTELARLRAEHGFASRQWQAGAEIIHDDDTIRGSVLMLELTDVIRARAAGADSRKVLAEINEAADALEEARAYHSKQCA